jgi:hypothetical protein
MAAAIENGANFEANPILPQGRIVPFYETIGTDNLETADDKLNLAKISEAYIIAALIFACSAALDAHATPTLDMDLVISEDGADSAAGTESIIFNGGTAFQAAITTPKVELWPNGYLTKCRDNVDGDIVLRTKVVTGAATAQSGVLKGLLIVI